MRQIVAQPVRAQTHAASLLLDSPPLLITNEGRTLVKMAGQVVLVVRAGYTARHAVQEAVALFDPQQAGGIILNQVAVAGGESYYGYGSYGYGSEGANKANGINKANGMRRLMRPSLASSVSRLPPCTGNAAHRAIMS